MWLEMRSPDEEGMLHGKAQREGRVGNMEEEGLQSLEDG